MIVHGESGQPDTNITTYTIPDDGTATGLLMNYATGDDTLVTVTITASGSPNVQTGTYGGSESDPGTDAYTIFHGIADMSGVIQYGSSGWNVDITFTGLDPNGTYTFVTTGNRDDDGYTGRIAKFTLLDADSAINTSSAGVSKSTTNFTEDTSAFSTGYNTVNGYVASWTDIQPGPDGDFTIRAEAADPETQYKAYASSVFKLTQESSGAQYNLNITDDGNGSVTLNPEGGIYYEGMTVTLTPVGNHGYMFSSWSGTDAGDLADNGDGTWSIIMDDEKEIIANFVESEEVTVTFQQGVNDYIGTVDTYIMEDEDDDDVDHGDLDSIEWDADDPYGTDQYKYLLIRFEDIFGYDPGQIPADVSIISATLKYIVSNTGDTADVNEVIVDWDESETWISFGGGRRGPGR